MDAVGALHTKLNFSVYEPRLRAVTGIWRQIEKLRAAALRDPKALPAYAKYLERCIKQADSEPDFTPEETAAACMRFVDLSTRLFHDLKIRDLEEGRRPSSWGAWSRKHLAREYDDYRAAMSDCEKTQNQRNFDNLNAALETVLRAYVGAI